jgi:hypothetical protein
MVFYRYGAKTERENSKKIILNLTPSLYRYSVDIERKREI